MSVGALTMKKYHSNSKLVFVLQKTETVLFYIYGLSTPECLNKMHMRWFKFGGRLDAETFLRLDIL